MKKSKQLPLALAAVLALAVGATAWNRTVEGTPAASPTVAPVDAGVTSILCAVPFELAEPYPDDWSSERAPVTSGWLVALEVDPELVRPRQLEEPVLQLGDAVVERINRGASGRVIGIVPNATSLEGRPAFFAAPELPERMDLTLRRRERDRATARGVAPLPATALAAATDCGGPKLVLAGRQALLDVAAQWILDHAPDEEALAFDLLRIPR